MRPFISAAKNTAYFIRDNWTTIVLLIVAWGAIIAGMGAMYGFTAVSLPITFGLGCGFAFGILTGLLTVHVLDPDDNHHGKNTLWDLINVGFYKLEANGTRPILLAVAISVATWAAGVIPTPIGVIFGIIMGNLVASRIGFYGSQNFDAEIEALAEDRREQAQRVQSLVTGHNELVQKLAALDAEMKRLAAISHVRLTFTPQR